MAQSTSNTSARTVGERGRNVADEFADKAADLAEQAGEQIERFTQQGRQATEQVQKVGENLMTAVDKSVKEQPLTTLAVAAGLGFVIGALWKS
jgi:ElaB/YqjD/DUF883 family membrane-anchored ribosome-binding protein